VYSALKPGASIRNIVYKISEFKVPVVQISISIGSLTVGVVKFNFSIQYSYAVVFLAISVFKSTWLVCKLGQWPKVPVTSL
jgi:hypothetical protein